jgi:hypothetical protein
VGTIIGELSSTQTAKWHQVASSTHRDAWSERMRCFLGLSEMLAEQAAASQGLGQQAPRGMLTEVARRAGFAAHETVYKKFRAESEGPIARWAGADDAVKPRNALVDEAKIVSFWPYRAGVLQIAGKFDMTLPELAEAYLRALAAWASDEVLLAACRPAGPPACVAEDLAVLAKASETGPATEKAALLEGLARAVVAGVLEDPTLTPAGAFEVVREDLGRLLAESADPLADQVIRAAAQLADRILHAAAGDAVLTPRQASRMLTTLTGLSGLLATIAASPQDAGAAGFAHGGAR